MNRHERRKQKKTGQLPRCKSCGERRGPQMAGSDGKMRCPVCHNMHVADATQATDTAMSPDHVLAQRLQEAVHQAVATVVGGDVKAAPIIANSLLATAATFAVQTAVMNTDPEADVTEAHTTGWRRNFQTVAGDYHRQVCEAMKLPVGTDAPPDTRLELPTISLHDDGQGGSDPS